MAPNHALMLFALLLGTVMQTLDSTIINVALPHMTGELSATPDSISWVATSYLVASVLIMPLTGFLNDRLGRKRFLLLAIGGFVISSGLCGIATTLPEMVIFRVMQGLCGGCLLPITQAVMVETFTGHERARAMAMFTMCTMIAPIVGPTLGGFLTETISWRWNFYINLPAGLLSLLLAMRYVPDTPPKQRNMDWIGFFTLTTSIACLQLMLDRGAEKDWFESTLISTMAVVALVAFLGFLWKSLAGRGHPILDLKVLKDRNLAVACVIAFCTGFGVFGNQLLLPYFMETQLGLSAMDAGMFLAPRSMLTAIVMGLVGRFGHRLNPLYLVGGGMVFNFLAALVLVGRMTPQTAESNLWLANVLQAIGVGLLFVPLTTFAFATMARHMAAEASGVFNVVRSVGISFGISLAVTHLNYSTKVHWDGMRGMITPYSQNVQLFLQQAGQHAAYFADASTQQLNGLGVGLVAQLVHQQAMVKGFISTYTVIAASFVVMLPLLLLMKTPQRKMAAPVAPAAAAAAD